MIMSCHKDWKGDGKEDKTCFKQDGVRRCYRVYKPVGYDESQEYPLVFAIHGRFGQGSGMDKFSDFNPVADEKGFLVCYPDGYKRSWADDRNTGPAYDAGIDDIAFFDEMINRISEDYSVNAKKIYACGMSNGAFMSVSLACHLSDRIAAVAAVAGNMAPSPENYCNGGPVPVLLIGGTDDPIVPYNGGEISGGSVALGFPDTYIFWRDHNGCYDFGVDSSWADMDPDDGTTVIVHSHVSCDSSTNVILYEVKGMGHTWPQGSQYLKESRIGKVSQEFNGPEVISNFLLSFELKQ